MVFHLPLDLQYWFVSVFAGSIDLFVILAILGIFMLGAIFRMPYLVILSGIFLFALMISTAGTEMFVIFCIILLGIVGYPLIRRLWD